MKELKILQYNVHKSKDRVMAPLLEDSRIHAFDILAIQEPWNNTHIATSYNPRNSWFYLAYPAERGRACLFINKRLDPAA